MGDTVHILGIQFYNKDVQEIITRLKRGGLMVVPSGPGLATIENEPEYYQSLLDADFAIGDSGYMALIWNILHTEKIKRTSGLKFLLAFFEDPEVKGANSLFLVNPSLTEATSNMQFLNSRGFKLTVEDLYVAPMYDKQVVDFALLSILESKKPKFVILNVGGGVQEKLGAFLKKNLTYQPAIICTGAAIAFLTGHQATIPTWGDRLYLGWLFRCIQDPARYIPRYWNAVGLIFILLKYGKNGPKR